MVELMNINVSISHHNLNAVFYIDGDQIAVCQEGQYWYTDVDEIMGRGIEDVHDDFETMLQIPPTFTYNDFYTVMIKMMALSTLIK